MTRLRLRSEADKGHVRKMKSQFGFETALSNGAWRVYGVMLINDMLRLFEELGSEQNRVRSDVPGERSPCEVEDEDTLPAHEVNKYGALVARVNYRVQDRSSLQLTV